MPAEPIDPFRRELAVSVLEAADLADMGVAITILDPKGARNVYVSDAAVRILGYPREELLDRPAIESIAPEERAQAADGRWIRDPRRFNVTVQRKDGTRAPVESVSSILTIDGQKAAVSFFWDVSAQRAAEEAHRLERERLYRVIAEAPDGIFIVRQAVVLEANRAGARLLGYDDPKDLVGHSLEEHIVPDQIALSRERMAARMRGESFPPIEYQGKRRDGSTVAVEIIAIAFTHEGAPAMLAFARDVTERVAMREQLASAERLAVLGTLAAGIAHEINNPLMAAMLQVDLLAHSLGATSGPVRDSLNELREMHDRIAFIARDLKSYSRADDDARAAVDLVELYGNVERILSSGYRGRLRPQVDLAGLPRVVGTLFRLEQVFVNLIVNSLQALPEGRLGNRITIRGHVDGKRVRIEFADNGTGIAPEHLDRVFTPFFTTKPAGVGTGLGLSVVKDIVTKYGGDVQIRSAPDEGTQVTMHLAIADGAEGPDRAPAEPRKRRRVVVIDDEALLAETLGVLLGVRNDAEVITDPERARARLLGDEPFDVVLCDLMMPGRTGMEIYEEVARTRPADAHRFVFMTGGAYTATASAFVERIEARCLLKPFDVNTAERVFAELGL